MILKKYPVQVTRGATNTYLSNSLFSVGLFNLIGNMLNSTSCLYEHLKDESCIRVIDDNDEEGGGGGKGREGAFLFSFLQLSMNFYSQLFASTLI